MGRIDDLFSALRAKRRKALMPFVCGQHPERGMTAAMLPAIERAGGQIVEVGVPYSDPIADGPVIASAMHAALARGSTPDSLFEEVASVRDTVSVGIVAMVSISVVHRMGGPTGFAALARQAGFDGLIIPDLPLEESAPAIEASRKEGLTLSLLVSPTTAAQRVRQIAEASTGFVYLLARAGVTGERMETPEIGPGVARIREATDLPIACGFGIRSAEQVRAVVRHADAAIVGSVIVRAAELTYRAGGDPVADVEKLTADLAAGLS